VLPLDPRGVAPALELASRLRDAGIAVALEPAGRSLKAMLRAADRRHARLALILGGEEITAGRVTVRDLARHEDHRQALALDAPGAELAAAVRALLGSDA